jgi:hypothetical protein
MLHSDFRLLFIYSNIVPQIDAKVNTYFTFNILYKI